jgi:hypothetical protein
MGFIRRLFGNQTEKPTLAEPIHNVISTNENQADSHESGYFSFYVSGLQNEFKEFSRIGESVNLWIPKDNPDRVYIYHRDGPGGCLGTVPSQYSGNIMYHLLNALDYKAIIEELTDNTCKIMCRLSSKEQTEQRKIEQKATLKKELTKAYNPKKPITMIMIMTTKRRNSVKVGDKLLIELNDLDSYIQHEDDKKGPYSSQWSINFFNQVGKIVGILDHDKATIQKILKAHFNSYLLDIEVTDTFAGVDYSEEKQRSNWTGYPIKLVITPYKTTITQTGIE